MNTRDFFRMIIKLFGLYILIQTTFYYLPSNILSQFYGFDIYSIVIVLAITLILYGIFIGLIKKVDAIIDFLKLDKGFQEDKIALGQFTDKKILSLAIVLVGGLLIVDYFPSLLYNLNLFIKDLVHTKDSDNLFFSQERVDYFDWGISCMNLVIGYLMIVNNSFIAKWLTKKVSVQDHLEE